jgi:hypothetical protein
VDARKLYQLPREEFTSERNALAAEQKKSGDSEDAAATKKLPKPSNPAWLVNRAAAEEPAAAKRLLKAGESLRKAYEGAAGRSGPEGLRRAIEDERAAVEDLIGVAGKLAKQAKIGGPALDRVRDTLHALGSNAELREEFQAGTVAKERKASGLGGAIAPGAGPAKSSKAKPDKAKGRRVDAARKDLEKASRALAEAREQMKQAEEELTSAAEAERAAKRALREAENA